MRELLLPYHHHLEVSTSWSLPSFGFVAAVFVVVVFKCFLVYRTVKAKELDLVIEICMFLISNLLSIFE